MFSKKMMIELPGILAAVLILPGVKKLHNSFSASLIMLQFCSLYRGINSLPRFFCVNDNCDTVYIIFSSSPSCLSIFSRISISRELRICSVKESFIFSTFSLSDSSSFFLALSALFPNFANRKLPIAWIMVTPKLTPPKIQPIGPEATHPATTAAIANPPSVAIIPQFQALF